MLKRSTPSDSEEACLDFGRMAAQVLELEPEGMTSSFVFSEDSSDEQSTSGTEVLDNFHRKRKVLWKKHDHQEQEVDQNVLKILQSIKEDARASGAYFLSEKVDMFQSSLISLADIEETSFSAIIGCNAAKKDLRMDLINHAVDKDWKHCSPSYCLYGPPGNRQDIFVQGAHVQNGQRVYICLLDGLYPAKQVSW